MNKKLEYSTNIIYNHLANFLINTEDSVLELLDPIENKVIGSHYSNSHFAAGAILWGHYTKNKKIKEIGFTVLESFINKSKEYETKIEFHYDFNNFILSVLLVLNDFDTILSNTLKSKIEQYILNTPDSKHYTVNWLLMREFTNKIRFKISKKSHYKIKAYILGLLISKAINSDGLIEDRLPKGKSSNPQYHAFSLSLMIFGKLVNVTNWEEKVITKGLYWLESIIDPLGDFNYFGRGTNQIFGWSSILFVANFNHFDQKRNKLLLDFFENNIQQTLKINSLLLENKDQDLRLTWYDYHFSSVYQAHLFFWLSLTHFCNKLNFSIPLETQFHQRKDLKTMQIYRSNKCFATIYKGSKHYLAEMGPQVSNITINKQTLFKGPFGPFLHFGNKSIRKTHAVENYFGPMHEEYKNAYILELKPIFPKQINISSDEKALIIEFQISTLPFSFNIPLLNKNDIELIEIIDSNGNLYSKEFIGTTFGPYGMIQLFRTSEIVNSSILICKINYSK